MRDRTFLVTQDNQKNLAKVKGFLEFIDLGKVFDCGDYIQTYKVTKEIKSRQAVCECCTSHEQRCNSKMRVNNDFGDKLNKMVKLI